MIVLFFTTLALAAEADKPALPDVFFARKPTTKAVQVELGRKDFTSLEKELKALTLVGSKGSASLELKKIFQKCTKLSESCGKEFAAHVGEDSEDCSYLGDYELKAEPEKLGEPLLAFTGKKNATHFARFLENKTPSVEKFKTVLSANWTFEEKARKLLSKEMDPNGKPLKEIQLEKCHSGELGPLSLLSCCTEGFPECPFWALEGSTLAFEGSSAGRAAEFLYSFDLDGKPQALLRTLGEVENKEWNLYSKGVAVWSRSEIFANEIVCD